MPSLRYLAAGIAMTLAATMTPALAAPTPAASGTLLVADVVIEQRRVVPIGTDHASPWGNVLIEDGVASLGGQVGTFLRRGLAVTSIGPGTQDAVQMTFPEGSLVMQASGTWFGPDEAAVVGGTGRYAGARGSASVTYSGAVSRWEFTLLDGSGAASDSQPTVLEYPRELVELDRISLAAEGSTVGNQARTIGRLLDDSGIVADYTSTSTVVQDLADGRERRAVHAMFDFRGGSLIVNGMIVAGSGALPGASAQYAVSGGTGVFAGVSGIAEYLPGGAAISDVWRFTLFGLDPDADARTIGPAHQEQTRYIRTLASGTAGGDVGDIVAAGGWLRSGAAPRAHWWVSAQVVGTTRDLGGVIAQDLLSFVQYSWGADKVFVLGVARTSPQDGPRIPTTRAVIGGLGAYVGASGAVTMRPKAPRQWRTTIDLLL